MTFLKLGPTTLLAALSLAMATAAFAADEYNVSNGLTLGGKPLGMHGTDPVSMFDGAAPKLGTAVHTVTHDGVEYYFSSEDAKKAFEANPDAYLPQFGGFCAFGVYAGKKLDGDVRYAEIIDGKLYLFVNEGVLNKFREDPETVLSGAFDKWPGMRSVPVSEL